MNKLYRITKTILKCTFAMFILFLCACTSSPTINLSKYIEIKLDGPDKYATATVFINEAKFVDDFETKLSFVNNDSYGVGTSVTDEFLKMISNCSVNKTEHVQNGDELEVVWDRNVISDLQKKIKCKITNYEISLKVSGLEKPTVFDAFENIQVSFTGISGEGNLAVEYSKAPLDRLEYHLSVVGKEETSLLFDHYNLKNGDTVVISISNGPFSIGGDLQYPKEIKKEYVVEGLPSYVEHLSDISDEQKEKFINEGLDHFKNELATEFMWNYAESHSNAKADISYYGDYLSYGGSFTVLTPGTAFAKNAYIPIYKVVITCNEGVYTKYKPITFYDISKTPDENYDYTMCEMNNSSGGKDPNIGYAFFYGYWDMESFQKTYNSYNEKCSNEWNLPE